MELWTSVGKPVLLQLIPGQLWERTPRQLTGPESACGLTQPATQSAGRPAWGQNRGM